MGDGKLTFCQILIVSGQGSRKHCKTDSRRMGGMLTLSRTVPLRSGLQCLCASDGENGGLDESNGSKIRNKCCSARLTTTTVNCVAIRHEMETHPLLGRRWRSCEGLYPEVQSRAMFDEIIKKLTRELAAPIALARRRRRRRRWR